MSRFALLASLLTVPKEVIIKVNALIYNFIWNGKNDKVKRTLLEQDFEQGGLKMLDFETMVKAAKIKWIKRYFDGEHADWKIMFETFCCKENLNVYLRSNFDMKELTNSIPSYYMESIKYWCTLKTNVIDGFDQFIWYNKRIKLGNKTVFCSRLFSSGVWKVGDLYHNNILIPFKTWLARGAKQADYMIWRGLLNAIPECMKNRIQVNSNLNKGVFKIEFCRIKLVTIDEATEKQIKAGIKCIAFNDMTQNEFKAKRKLESIHGAIHKEEWVTIYTLYRSLNVDNHTKDLQYKILYRIVPTNKLLYKMRKVNSNMCDFCEIQIDTIEHALWECVVVKSFWLELFQIWNNLNHTDINPCKKT